MGNKLTTGRFLIVFIIAFALIKTYWHVFVFMSISAIVIWSIIKAIKKIQYSQSLRLHARNHINDSKSYPNQGEIIISNTAKPHKEIKDLKSIRCKAEDGDAQAKCELGMIYDGGYFANGQDIPQDNTEAVKWYRLAANHGHPTAQYNLGWMYYAGAGVEQDYDEALRLTQLASENGMPNTQARFDLIKKAQVDYIEEEQWHRLTKKQVHSATPLPSNKYETDTNIIADKNTITQSSKAITAKYGTKELTTPLTENKFKTLIKTEKSTPDKLKSAIDAEILVQTQNTKEIAAIKLQIATLLKEKITSYMQSIFSTMRFKEMQTVYQDSPNQSYALTPSGNTTKSSETTGIVNTSADKLETYCRFINNNSIDASSNLPSSLLKNNIEQELIKLEHWFERIITFDDPILVSFASLLWHMSIKKLTISKKEAIDISNLLESINIGIEPDSRFSDFIPNPEHNVVLFRISEKTPKLHSSEYSVATFSLHLATAFALTETTVHISEKKHWKQLLEIWPHLSSDEKIRLQAHTLFIQTSGQTFGINDIKKHIAIIDQSQKESLWKFLVGIAQLNGCTDITKIKNFTQLYIMLGLDALSIPSHTHEIAVEPIAIQTPDFLPSSGYSIPAQQKIADGISLDMDEIKTTRAEDNAISSKTLTKKIVSTDELWVPFGKVIEHSGYTIPDGLVYFGNGLKSIIDSDEEPSLIDITLPVDKADPDFTGRNMGYWPKYSHIHPTSRAAYLDWLATGRKDPDAHIGYVFLFFYGLERRVFIDIQNDICTAEDLPIILNEVQRLLAIYRENASFRQYAHKFQEVLQMLSWGDSLYKTSPSLEFYSWCEIPLIIKAVLGQLADDRVSLPAEWALAWAINDPSMPNRMLIERCMLEFQELFKFQYAQKYKTGLLLSPKKTRLKVTYRAASPLFFGRHITILREDLSDVTDDSGAISQIQEIVNSCTIELKGYSRVIWLNPDNKYSLEATSLLPKLLLKRHLEKESQRLMIWLEQQIPFDTPVQISFQSILEVMPRINQNCFGKKEVISIANFLGKIGYGIEPDPRFGNFVPKQDHDVVLFRIGENAPTTPSDEYSAAAIILHLASAVATADGTVTISEKKHLEDHLETWLHLSSDEKIRLQAHMLFLLSSFPGMNNIKKRIESLQHEQRESLGKFLVSIAQLDGYIDVTEMKILTRIYTMLGLDAQRLYSHAHTAAVAPVAVQTADFANSQGYSIPAPKKISDGIYLDLDKIKTIRAESNAISSILNDIFSENQHEQIIALISDARTTDIPITGLDPESFAFMKALACKLMWAREEQEKLAADHSLMLDGTLENINDASFDHFGVPFFEGYDPIEIDQEVAKMLQ